MTEVDLQAVYRAAEGLLRTGMDGGTALTQALKAISSEGVRAACGDDDGGKQIFEGFSTRAGYLADAGTTLQQSVTNLADLVSGGAALLQQTDGHNAEAVTAASLGLQADGQPLPAPPATPGG